MFHQSVSGYSRCWGESSQKGAVMSHQRLRPVPLSFFQTWWPFPRNVWNLCVQGGLTTQLNCTHPDFAASLLELLSKACKGQLGVWNATMKTGGQNQTRRLTWSLRMWNPPTRQCWVGLQEQKPQSLKEGLDLQSREEDGRKWWPLYKQWDNRLRFYTNSWVHHCLPAQVGSSAAPREVGWDLQPSHQVAVGENPQEQDVAWRRLLLSFSYSATDEWFWGKHGLVPCLLRF